MLGWTGRINGSEYQRLKDDGYYPEDLLGKAGLESTYEDVLRGTYGLEKVDLDPQGHEVQTPDVLVEPEAGRSLVLTIDTDVQRDAQKALRWAMDRIGVKRGAFIAMNPQNGEVLAMVSLPSYDNNQFAQGIAMSDYNALLKDPSKPMLNVAINEQYPPGSTYKLVTGTGALQDGKIGPATRIQTKPFLEIGDWKYWEWNREGWGALNIYDGFGHSSDTFFYQLAGRLGIDRLAYWAHQFGFGKPTGIELPGEASGIVPTNAWKRRTLNESYFTGELYQAGIGQGYNSSTPMQVLNAYAALANGGTIYKPQLVRKILDSEGNVVERVQPEVVRQMDVDRSTLRMMRAAARRVVTIRHTDNLVDLPIVVAGKSGTAEFGVKDKQGRLPFSNWFAAFVPRAARKTASDPTGINAVKREDSNLVVLAYLDDTRTKGNAATEVVKYFLQLHYGIKTDLRNHHYLQRDNDYSGSQLMSAIRLEPARVGTLTAREGEGRWYGFDLQLAIFALSLTVIGLLMAFTNSGDDPLRPGSVFTRGLIWLALAIVIFVATAAADHHWLRTFVWPIYGFSIALLLLTLVFGSGVGGVSRWVSVFGLQFQFSEVAKILLAVVLAHYLATRSSDISSLRTLIGAGLIVGPLLALVLIQPDLGTSLVFGAIMLGSLFMAGASLRWLTVTVLAVLAMVPVAWGVILRDYQKQRLISFIDPAADPLGSGTSCSSRSSRSARAGSSVVVSPTARRVRTCRSDRPTSSSLAWAKSWASSVARSCSCFSRCSSGACCTSAGDRVTPLPWRSRAASRACCCSR